MQFDMNHMTSELYQISKLRVKPARTAETSMVINATHLGDSLVV